MRLWLVPLASLMIGCFPEFKTGVGYDPTKLPPHCADGEFSEQFDRIETDVDCGGSCAEWGQRCSMGQKCWADTDCESRRCIITRFDCFGPDCTTGWCKRGTDNDGIQSDGETDVDCGGPDVTVSRCRGGSKCTAASDCKGDTPQCTEGKCVVAECALTCGKIKCARCADGGACTAHDQCESNHCAPGGKCAPRSCTDGVKNGDEGDVDCGGFESRCPRCEAGRVCQDIADCSTDDPNDKRTCIADLEYLGYCGPWPPKPGG